MCKQLFFIVGCVVVNLMAGSDSESLLYSGSLAYFG